MTTKGNNVIHTKGSKYFDIDLPKHLMVDRV